jgi:serine/threonine-protein kinase RsbW
MVEENKHLEVVLDTQVESVNLAEEMCLRVAEAAGFDEEMCYRIGMSVREGVINAFHYGNQERPEKKIHLAMDLTPDKLVIHVMDEGKGFKLSDVPDPLAEENILSTSGRGIFLMRAFMDEFDVVPEAPGERRSSCPNGCREPRMDMRMAIQALLEATLHLRKKLKLT